MRLTVGPLPPAVYWRRRAVVVGAGLLFLVVVLYSCSYPGNSGSNPSANGSPTPSVDATPSGPVLLPETGSPAPGGPGGEESSDTEGEPAGGAPPDGEPASGGPGDVGQVPADAPAPGDGACTDEVMSVIPVPSQTSMKVGVTIEILLKIKNVSSRACSRDIGADAQEVYLRIGAEKIWSSDTCGTASGSDVRSMEPNIEHEYRVAWNGRKSTRCAGGAASGPNADAGSYQLFGRVGTKLSEPVTLTINR